MNSPEDQILHSEDLISLLDYSSQVTDKFMLILLFFIPKVEFEVFRAVKSDCLPVRNAAIKFHMSRYNIRKTCKVCQQKIDTIKQLIELWPK